MWQGSGWPRVRRLFEQGMSEEDRDALILFFVVAGLSAASFFMIWRVGGPGITLDYTWGVIRPARYIELWLAGDVEVLWPIFASGLSTAGSQFFLYPVLAVAGWSPVTLKTFSVAIHTLAVLAMFFAFRRRFDSAGIGASLALMVLTVYFFLRMGNVDYPFVFLLSSVFVYLYVRWQEAWCDRFLYGMALVAGVMLYVKATALYLVAALFLATLVVSVRRVRQLVTAQRVLAVLAIFVLGSLPFWYFQLHTGFPVIEDAGTVHGPPQVAEAVGQRFHHLLQITAPVTSTPVRFHTYTGLFVTGIAAALYTGTGTVYVVAALLLPVLAAYTPQPDLAPRHLAPVIPLFFMVIGENWSALRRMVPERQASIFLAAAVAGVFLVAAPQMLAHPWQKAAPFTEEDFNDVKRLDVSQPVATNFRDMFYLAQFDRDIPAVHAIAEPQEPEAGSVNLRERLTAREAARRANSGSTVLLLLAEEEGQAGTCLSPRFDGSICGFSTTDIRPHLDESVQTESVFVAGHRYIVIRGRT